MKIKKIILTLLVVILAVVAALAAVGYFMVYKPALDVYATAQVLRQQGAELKFLASQNDIDLLATKTAEIRKTYKEIQVKSQKFQAFSFVPHVKDYFAGLAAGEHLLSAGSKSIDAIAPYADLIGFKKGKSSLFDKSTDERLQTAVLTIDKLTAQIDPIAGEFELAKKTIDTIDPERYPETFMGKPVRSQIVNIKDQFDGIFRLVVNAKPFLKELPRILGKDRKQTYMIIFQNDKELRATGGFWTGTTELSIDRGKLEFQKVTNIYDIDSGLTPLPAPEPIKAYFKGVNKWYLRDANISPDLPTSVANFESMYKKYGAAVQYDGIFFIDTKILVDLLTIFGDRYVDGINFSATKDKRCDCPQVIYELSDMIGRPVGYVKTERKAILSSLLRDLSRFAIGASPSKYWGKIMQVMLLDMDEKHVLMYFKNPQTQAAAEAMGWAGRISKPDGNDYLHVVNVNFGGQKSNLFVNVEVNSKTVETARTVKVIYKNPFPYSDCNLESGGLCLNAPLRNWVRLYVPKGSKLTSFKGSLTEVKTYDEFDKTVFEGFLIVEPQNKAEIDVAYTLPASVNNGKLNIQKQAGTEGHIYKVLLNGTRAFNGPLKKDTSL